MQLTEQEQRDIEEMKNTQWWKILEKIEKEARQLLWERMMKFNVSDEKDIENIKNFQIYAEAREDFFSNIEKLLKKIYIPK